MRGKVSQYGDFVFAQPRLQARHAAFLSADVWAELEQTADFGQFLQLIRETALAPAAETFGTSSSIDDMEIALRHTLIRRVEELAAWLPEAWQPSVLFVQTLPLMPLLRHAREEGDLPWMTSDPGIAARLPQDGPGDHAPLPAARVPAVPDTAGKWLSVWRGLWPEDTPGLLDVGLQLVEAALLDYGGEIPWAERRIRLSGNFRRAFRRHAFQPIAAFAHLGLLFLEFGRLRGNLSVRRAHLSG